MLASVVIRTYNEQRHLDELLVAVNKQQCKLVDMEVVVVDSGSTDDTLDIANRHGCRVTHIRKEDFSYGRSLNVGCSFARGDILVFISGHCVPVNDEWLDELCRPLKEGVVDYSYGRQIGKNNTKFSETRVFEKWFPDYSKLPQDGFFCNNANAAVRKEIWEKYRFNEELTGLEDMYLAKQLVEAGKKVGYTSTSVVYHMHDENWRQVRIRYEREAYALHQIMPEVHLTWADSLRFFMSSVLSDFAFAIREKQFHSKLLEILLFRIHHYWGSYRGNHEHRKLSAERKHEYFYPKDLDRKKYENSSTSPYESQQRTGKGEELS